MISAAGWGLALCFPSACHLRVGFDDGFSFFVLGADGFSASLISLVGCSVSAWALRDFASVS
jgi:hypothetical protein